ncbi:hypothetical protein TrCOL_g2957 [Triparma columacea]|uniref:Uncharacterized protein n=1 Tax=Triparma columacea TaxID=722753 RepID=A0A9W7L6C7_9STRA|nr:hypothetical protein TrCOL_g2957 [Triparma columacea]
MGYGGDKGVDGVRLVTEVRVGGGYCYYVVAGNVGGAEVDGIGVEEIRKEGLGGEIPKVIQDALDGGAKAYYV